MGRGYRVSHFLLRQHQTDENQKFKADLPLVPGNCFVAYALPPLILTN